MELDTVPSVYSTSGNLKREPDVRIKIKITINIRTKTKPETIIQTKTKYKSHKRETIIVGTRMVLVGQVGRSFHLGARAAQSILFGAKEADSGA